MRQIRKSKKFVKSYEKILKSGYKQKDVNLIDEIVLRIALGEKLEPKFSRSPACW